MHPLTAPVFDLIFILTLGAWALFFVRMRFRP